MRYAILSDIHGRRDRLVAVLDDARVRGADQIVSLGDVGGDPCLALLRQAGALAVFGNYEVSGWSRLKPEHRAWVRSWKPLLVEDSFLAVHAAPWWPDGLQTVEEFDDWLRRTGCPWRALFPYLSEDDEYLWRALATLETTNVGHPVRAILFHGHTHQQAVWEWNPAGLLRQVQGTSFSLRDDHRYLVGVGSVGMPEDTCWAAYALYDAEAGQIELIRLRGRW